MRKVFYFMLCAILTLPILSCSTKTCDVTIMGFPRELLCFLEDLGAEFDGYCGCGCDQYVDYGIDGDISYRNREPIEPDSTVVFEDCDGEPIMSKAVFSLDNLDKHKYTIKSHSNGGFMLSVNAKKTVDDFYDTYANCKLIYKKIVFVHPLQMPHDSVICTNLNFDYGSYGVELIGFDSRPCAGNVKVYRVDGNEKYLLREMVEASEERTVWKEYYPNGNVKSIATTSNNPQEIDEDGFAAEPYVTNTEYYFDDGQKDQIFMGKEFAVFPTSRRYHTANSVIHLILYPEDRTNINQGEAFFVGSDFNISEPFEIARCSYRINNNCVYFTNVEKKELFCWGTRRTPRRYFVGDNKAEIVYDDYGHIELEFNNFLDEGGKAIASLSPDAFDRSWIMSLPSAFRKKRSVFSSERVNEPVKSYNW